MIDSNDTEILVEFPSASNNVVNFDWSVAPHDVVVRVQVVDLDTCNAGVVSIVLSDRSRGTPVDARPTGEALWWRLLKLLKSVNEQ